MITQTQMSFLKEPLEAKPFAKLPSPCWAGPVETDPGAVTALSSLWS